MKLLGPTENTISSRFNAACVELGYITIKLSTLGRYGESGWPDRLVLGPERRVVFVELKRPGGKVPERQAQCHERLRALDFTVFVESDVKTAIAHVEECFKNHRYKP